MADLERRDGPESRLEELSIEEAFSLTGSAKEGLTTTEALRRRKPATKTTKSEISLFLRQFRSPILLLLAFSAALSGFLGEATDALTIFAILLASTALSYYQERQASVAVLRLLSLVATKFQVLRDGRDVQVGIEEVVRGDVLSLSAGGVIPGDGLILNSQGLLVDEAALTGESVPVEKNLSPGKEGTLFAGTHVQSGSATMLVVRTGSDTLFGQVSAELRHVLPEPQFQQGIRRYGYLLMESTLFLTMAVFLINYAQHKPVLESFLFSLALAVGLTPQLLPAIVSVTLANGARQLAQEKVIVKRLEAIEDFGSMDVLCSDKTGTLTEGNMKVVGGFSADGAPSDVALSLAQLNAIGSRSFDNAIDQALRESAPDELLKSPNPVGEIPYDFQRRRQSVAVGEGDKVVLLTKGAVANVLDACADAPRARIEQSFKDLSDQGLRVLGVAKKQLDGASGLTPALEEGMEFVGLVAFEDPLRADAQAIVEELRKKGVRLKLITGDNRHVAAHIAAKVGLASSNLLTGADLDGLTERALLRHVRKVDVYAEVDPIQKERLLLAIKKAGHVVGYLGDGINDGPALHAADVGISVSTAVDVAREAADFVMLERGLGVISKGIDEGRRIFANTMKYVFITSSANLGNMVSMALASLFLPFLPLLPKQVLLNNFITDIPALSIAGDSVDTDLIRHPRRWRVDSVRRFMIVFGLHSSVFDLLTFAILLWVVRAGESTFHTAWFLESAISELLILLIIRSRMPLLKSRPGRSVAIASASCGLLVVLLPLLPFAADLGFVPIPIRAAIALSLVLVAYASTAELLKARFMRRT